MRVLAFFLWICSAAAQQPDLSITWIGQSSFILRTTGGPTVVTDPPVASVGYAIPAVAADAVTITHNHTDHNNAAGVGGTPVLVDGRPVTARTEMPAAGMTFTLIPGFHDNQNGAQRGPNTMIAWTQAGLKIAHLGDLGQDQLTDAQASELRNLDILFVPAGGFFTITPERAAAYVKELNPRVAILMHYRTGIGGPAQLAGVPAASAPFSPVIYKSSTVVVKSGALPVGQEVWVMQPLSDASAVNAAGFTAGAPLAPGSVMTVFGSFRGSETAPASAYPLPRKIGDTEVLVDGKAVPLFYVSPGQINAQVSAAQAVGPAAADIRVNGQSVGRAPLTIVPFAPGLFGAINADGKLNSASAPAKRGDVLQIFGTGQGAVTPAQDDGVAAGSSVALTPNVFLDGRQLDVTYSGLAPGLAGVWQLNVAIPRDARTGPALLLSIVQGTASTSAIVAVAE